MCVLETKRLKLRELTLEDLPHLYEILSDKETMQHYPKPYQKTDIENLINRNINSYSENGYGLWAVILKEKNQCIGECGITNQCIDGEIVPEIGYHIHKSCWKKGYATEAAKGCVHYGFSTIGFKTIYIHTSINNVPSYRVAEKLEFTKIKEYDKFFKRSNTTMRHVVYRMNRQG